MEPVGFESHEFSDIELGNPDLEDLVLAKRPWEPILVKQETLERAKSSIAGFFGKGYRWWISSRGFFT